MKRRSERERQTIRTAVWAALIPILGAAATALVFLTERDAAPTASLDRALGWADSTLAAAVAEERIPGAVLLVARDGRVLHHEAYGWAKLYDYDGERLERPEPLTTAHLFDLASVSKVLGTTYAVMLLVDEGALALDAPVSRYLPEFTGPRKDSVTVRHLLTHTAGLAPWKPTYYHASTAQQVLDYIAGLPLESSPGAERRYSDLGFMLLGYIVERVSGEPLDVFLERRLYAPLGLENTGYRPTARGLGPFAATSPGNPFERRMVADDDFGYRIDDVDPAAFDGWRDYTVQGEVSDGNAWYAHGGVAGHAGLFSTAAEARVLVEVLLNDGEYDGRHVVSRETVRAFLTPTATGDGLGWWMAPGRVGLEAPPPGSFAHSGFTGTYVLGVPAHDLVVVLLTNRENLGVDEDGRYPDVDAIRRPVVERIVRAAEAEAEAGG